MHDADRPAGVNYDQGRDLCGIQDFQRLAGKLIGTHGLRIARHDIVDTRVEQVGPHMAPQIAVGDDSDQATVTIGDADAAEALGRHFDDRVGHAFSGMPDRLYVIDRSGRVAYQGGRGPFGFRPGELEQAVVLTLVDDGGSPSTGQRGSK